MKRRWTRAWRRRRWWQHALRLGGWGVLVLVAAYVTIPWWAPTGWIRRHVEGELSRQVGTTVTIQELSLSWDEIRVEGLSVTSPAGSSEPPLAVAEYVRLPMEPINILLGRDVEWMEVEGLTLSARVGPEGETNLAPLARLKLDSQPRRVSLRDATFNLLLPDQPQPLRLEVTDLQYVVGPAQRLGELTLSARLVQQGQPDAPISFRLTRAPGDPSTIAAATFLFDDVDLAAVNLPELLGLPLRTLEGHMEGQLEFRMNPRGVFNRASLQVAIRQLNAQPAGGPQLEVIDRAGVHVSASWDPLGENIHLRSLALQLPGSIRVAGSAKLKPVYPEPWECIESLELRGMVNPSRLAALLTGRDVLVDGWRVDGPVEWRVRARHRNRRMLVDELAFDAGSARIRHGSRTLKDAGAPLTFTTAAVLDDRTWRAELNDLRIKCLGLTVDGNAAWNDVRTLPTLGGAEGPIALAAVAMDNVACDLCVRARRLDGLSQLGKAAKQLTEAVKLQGRAEARVRINAPNTHDVLVDLRAPEETVLAVGAVFRKPRGTKLEGRLSADVRIDPNAATIALDPSVQLRVGEGTATVRDATLRWPALSGSGLFHLEEVESYLVRPSASAGPMLTGSLGGKVRFADLTDPENRSVELYAALDETGIDAGPWYVKPADEHLRLRAQLDGPTAQAWLTGPAGSLHAWTTADLAAPWADPNASGGVDVAVEQARRLVSLSPWLAGRLKGWSLSGPMQLSGSLHRRTGRYSIELSADATETSLTCTAGPKRTKPGGVPLRFEVELVDAPGRDGRRALSISRLIAAVGAARLIADGSADWDPHAHQPAGTAWPVAGLEALDANVALAGRPDGLSDLLPELAGSLEAVTMTEDASFAGQLRLGERGVSLEGTFDAGDGKLTIGPVVKPARWRGRARVELRGSSDLTEWTLGEVHAELIDPNHAGDRTVLARVLLDAAVRGQLGRDGLPRLASFRPTAWHAWLATDHAGKLTAAWPGATGRLLAGAVRMEAENRSGRWGRIDVARVSADGVRGVYRGREVTLSGELTASNVGWSPRSGWTIGSLSATDLEATAGPNHAWLIAELQGLPRKPAGRVRLLADTLDDADLVDWLGLPAPTDPNAVELSERQTAQLQRSARELIAQLRRPLARTNVTLHGDVETLRTTDVSVNQTYDMNHLRADLIVRDGRFDADLAAILNGGSYRVGVRAKPVDPSGPVDMEFHLLKVIGTEAIQPQLAKYFPGNTVEGLFTRDEELRETLPASIAYFLDHRYPWTPTGSAKTVATDGYIVGRAVPEWMAGIFPQLNLQRYEYRKMTGFATYLPDGVALNDMIFSGEEYDVYMEGTTDAENRARYTVGLLLAGGSAEWNHAWKTGRLPLLKVRGTIYGGELLNREVSFLWPNETILAVTVKNNPLVRAFINRKKEKLANQP